MWRINSPLSALRSVQRRAVHAAEERRETEMVDDVDRIGFELRGRYEQPVSGIRQRLHSFDDAGYEVVLELAGLAIARPVEAHCLRSQDLVAEHFHEVRLQGRPDITAQILG